MWNSKSFFFGMRKQGKKHSVQDYKDHIIPWLQWLPTALRIKSKILHTATVPASVLSTVQAASHFAPTIPRSVSNLFLSLLLQTNSDSSLPFALSLHFPGKVCFSSWACLCIPCAQHQRRAEHLFVACLNKQGRIVQGGCPVWWWPSLSFPWAGFLPSQEPSKASLRNGKAKWTLFEILEGYHILLPPQTYTQHSKMQSSNLSDKKWAERFSGLTPAGLCGIGPCDLRRLSVCRIIHHVISPL